MLPDAPSSDYFLLTTIIFTTGVIPLVVVFLAVRRHSPEGGAAVSARIPRWVWWLSSTFLVTWWFASAWLFLRD